MKKEVFIPAEMEVLKTVHTQHRHLLSSDVLAVVATISQSS
jgi:hypothetical protein